jgi:hypothetical protein
MEGSSRERPAACVARREISSHWTPYACGMPPTERPEKWQAAAPICDTDLARPHTNASEISRPGLDANGPGPERPSARSTAIIVLRTKK